MITGHMAFMGVDSKTEIAGHLLDFVRFRAWFLDGNCWTVGGVELTGALESCCLALFSGGCEACARQQACIGIAGQFDGQAWTSERKFMDSSTEESGQCSGVKL